MNNPLVERIERLIGLCADPGTEHELTLILADVRELVDAAKVAERRFSNQNGQVSKKVWCENYPAVSALSAILRKVGGE